MAETYDNDSNVEKSGIDFHELDGQLELIVQHLEKKEKKKAVSYYFKESTIERIKNCAQKFNMKDSMFLEEAINKLIDVIENRNLQGTTKEVSAELPAATPVEVPVETQVDVKVEVTAEQRRATCTTEKPVVTPWARLAGAAKPSVEATKPIAEAIKSNTQSTNSNVEVVNHNVEATKSDAETIRPAISVAATDFKQLEQLEAKLLDHIFNNYRPDYRMLYRRFEQKVQAELAIEPDILLELVRKLDRQGELTYYEKQNLVDINKKLFEARIPNMKENTKYFEDDDFIE